MKYVEAMELQSQRQFFFILILVVVEVSPLKKIFKKFKRQGFHLGEARGGCPPWNPFATP